jgi:tripartite ATP-independent transporter DctM subunit
MVASVYVRCRINPALGPRGPITPFREKLVSLKDSFGVVFLFLLVIGGIYLGFFTPTEAGAIGAFGALVLGMVMGRFKFRNFSEAVIGAIGLAAMIFFIFIYATAITQFLAVTQLPIMLADYVAGLDTPRYLTLCLILFSYLILGCVMNALPVVILTLPIIYPTVSALEFDSIWFGVLLVMMVEIGQITPPIGMSVFAMSGVAPDVPMYTIFKGVFPFWLIMVAVVALVIIFPQIGLFLPDLMMGN